MPLDHGCRLDQHHGIEDLRPNPEKPKPEKSVRGEEPNPTWVLPTQDAHLMPQANQLELQGGAAAKPEGEDGNDSGQNRNHACDGTAVRPKALDFRQFAVLSVHKCLSKVALFGERSLRRALSQYVEHFHAERNHQGKGDRRGYAGGNDSLYCFNFLT